MGIHAIALDPGGTTGIAIVRDSGLPWTISVGQMTGLHYRQLFRLLNNLMPEYVICESFENRGASHGILTSVEYIGIVKLYLQRTPGTCGVWQNAATGKAFWKDDKLKEYKLDVPGQRHAKDAVRHYAAWRTFTLKDRSLLEHRATATIRPAVFHGS
jgi:hypothetical protein